MNKKEIKSDGFGEARSQDGLNVIKIWINVRRDKEMPDFDAIKDLKYEQEGKDNCKKYNDIVIKMATEHMGMFVNDGLKLEEKDIYSIAKDNTLAMNGKFPAIPALRALKKALEDYLCKTDQNERLKLLTEKVICKCRNVTNYDIKDAIKRGKTTFELIRDFTGAGTGCGSCVNKVKKFLE